jgi:8-oxo-dGTP pyrophosphatase MutT (NUDIX family)/transcriptional regulator with XRE-family HTH domain
MPRLSICRCSVMLFLNSYAGKVTVRIEEIVGQRIRQRREELELSQAQFGKLVGSHFGRDWSRQTVSAVEAGDRNFAAAELVMLAHVLQVSVGHLLTPPPGVEMIEVAPGVNAERDVVMLALVPAMAREDQAESKLQEAFVKLLRDIKLLNRAADDVAQDMDHVQRLSMTVAQSGGRPAVGEEVLEQPVVAAIVTSPLGVLVGKRRDGKPPWTFIAGEQDAVQDENPADTAVREVKEETGLRVEAGDVIGERYHPRTGRHMVYVAARPTRGTDVIVGDEEELAEVRWVSLAELDGLMGAGNIFEPVREHLARELGEG